MYCATFYSHYIVLCNPPQPLYCTVQPSAIIIMYYETSTIVILYSATLYNYNVLYNPLQLLYCTVATLCYDYNALGNPLQPL